MSNLNPIVIGRAEYIIFAINGKRIPAKVDTGADRSSIWASNIHKKGDDLTFELFEKGSPYYDGKTITIPKGYYRYTRVSSSFGHTEWRYVVKFKIILAGKKINASFTLADRQSKVYPILIGRRLLTGKFIVDVSKGTPLRKQEKKFSENLQNAELN